MGIIDRTIGLFSPRAVARREAFKLRAEIIKDARQTRGYQGASKGRRVANWKADPLTPDEVLKKGGAILRDRCRDLVRNNPHAANIITKHADNIVGDGITPRAKTGNPDRDIEINALFADFSRTIDPEGLTDFYGKQHQAVRGMAEVGEIIVRKRSRRPSDGLVVPLQIQLLDPEFLDDARFQPSGRSGNIVRHGIEFDKIGRRRGYWLFKQNPRSAILDFDLGRDSAFVPAEDIAHLFEVRRTVRGEPWLAPVMTRLHDIDEYDGSERLRKKIEACMVGVVTPAEDAEEDLENPERLGSPVSNHEGPIFDEFGVEIVRSDNEEPWPIVDRYGDEVEKMEPGTFYYARGGSSVEFNTPASSNGYDTYIRTSLKGVASGARMPYEVMTGDLSDVSYASGRMGTVEYRRFVGVIQWTYVIPMFCQPIWDWFVEAAILAGKIRPDEVVGVEWTTPAFQSISPVDDSSADFKDVRNGFMSWDEAVTKRGFDPDTVAKQIVERNKFWDREKVILDSDPRYVSQNGQKHQQAGTAGAEGVVNAPGEQDREARGDTGRARHRSEAQRAEAPGGRRG